MTDPIDVSKASSQLSGLLTAVGLEAAWGAVSQAGNEQLGESERDAVLREIATMQLTKAGELVKVSGLTPDVVQLLQLLINLMAGMPGLAPEQAPQAEAPPAQMDAGAEAQAKELPAPLDHSGTAPHHDAPAQLPDQNQGQYGQTASGEPSFTAASADETRKDLPPPQNDPQPSAPQNDPQPAAPRGDNVKGGTGGGGAEGGDADPLDAAQSDPPPATPQKDPQPGTPTKKSIDIRTGLPIGGGWWHSGDIGRKDPAILKRKQYRKVTG